MAQIWPNFFIVGAPKAGTTSLYEYIKKIPEIHMSFEKEPNYFSAATVPDGAWKTVIRDKQKYLKLFKNVVNVKVIGEASPTYLADPEAPKLIHQVSPDAKILISLRNPISRSFSHYLMLKRLRSTELIFSDIIEGKCNKKDYFGIINRSFYHDNIKQFIDIFGKDNVKIIIFEEWIKDPSRAIKEILDFLNISHDITVYNTQVFNQFGIPRGKIGRRIYHSKTIRKYVKYIPVRTRKILKDKIVFKTGEKPSMELQQRRTLEKLFHNDVKKLEKLLNYNPNWYDFNEN